MPRRAFRPQSSGLLGRALPAWIAAAFLACALAPRAARAQLVDDDLVPAGTLQARATLSQDTQTKAVATDSVIHGLEYYVLPDPSDKYLVSGTVSRVYDEADLLLELGITDRWNLSLLVPYVQATQTSTLRVLDPGANPALTATVADLQSKTVSGMGNLRLTSLHRPLFSDFNGFVWGYGYQGSPSPNSGVYTGVGSLQTHDPYGGVFTFAHYTHYPTFGRARFDLRGEFQYPFTDSVMTPTGGRVAIQAGPTEMGSISWEHEPGAWGYGVGLIGRNTAANSLNGVTQEDPVKEWMVHAQLEFGNLIELETSPIRFPYQALLAYDETVMGFNVPMRARWSLVFRTYF